MVRPVRPRGNRCTSARWSAGIALGTTVTARSRGWPQSRQRQTCAGIKSILQSSRLLGLLHSCLIEGFNSAMTGSFSGRAGVGQNLQDHIDFAFSYRSRSLDNFGVSFAGFRKLWKEIGRYRRDGVGMVASNIAECGGFLKTDPSWPAPRHPAPFQHGHGRQSWAHPASWARLWLPCLPAASKEPRFSNAE